MTCAPAYGLGTSKKKKKKKKTLRRLWLVPRPMAWAQVKKKKKKKKTLRRLWLVPRPMAWAQVTSHLYILDFVARSGLLSRS